MTTENQNFEMWQGESVTLDVPITDENNAAFAMTGSTVAWKLTTFGGTLVLSKSTADDVSLEDSAGTDDMVRVVISPGDTRTVAPNSYYQECRITDASSDENVLFTGRVDLYESQTA